MAWTKTGTRLAMAGYLLVGAAVLGGLTWATVLAVHLDRTDAAARQERERSRDLRSAVRRLDARVQATISRETSRDPTEYEGFIAPEDLWYVGQGRPVPIAHDDLWYIVGNRLVPPGQMARLSPLINRPIEPWILGHFEVSHVTDWTSPQAGSPVSAAATHMLTALRQRLTPARLGQLLAEAHERDNRILAVGDQPGDTDFARRRRRAEQVLGRPPEVCDFRDLDLMLADHSLHDHGWTDDGEDEQVCPSPNDVPPDDDGEDEADDGGDAAIAVAPPGAEGAGPGVMWDPSALTGIWLTLDDGPDPYLALVRTVSSDDDRVVYQGVVVVWAVLRDYLLREISDLCPGAALVPVGSQGVEDPEELMTHLPVRLDVSACPVPAPAAGWRPMHTGLAVAWAAAVIVLIAAGVGVHGLLTLAERRSQFAYAVSHELRTPLTTFRLYTDMLADGLVPEESRNDYLQTLNAESQRLTQLVTGVLEYSQLEHHAVQPTLEEIAVDDLLHAAAERFGDRCRQADHELFVQPAGGDLVCRTDPELVLQIIGTLVDNACKYAREAEDRRVILSACNGGAGRVQVEVRDFGPGVPRNQRRAIFKPFRRGRHGANIAPGIGLGLALAGRWAKVLDAKLELVHPQRGQPGARFRLTLPA